MNDEVFAKLEKMFRTCHAIAKHNRPFKDFVWQCKLDKGKGLKIGTTYNNDKSARMFAQEMADISCGSTRAFAHGKVGIYPQGVCVLCVTDIPTVKLPTGNHYGYIKKNKRITHDIPRTK